MIRAVHMADLFCGAGGTSEGAIRAIEALGYVPRLTVINHMEIAIATQKRNHPDARHLCTSIDDVNPRSLFRPGQLQLLWASPECTHHSTALGGKPINEQSRATAWCVTRWAEALRPPIILVENVPEFRTWGPLNQKNRPIKSKKGNIYRSWKSSLESIGYKVEDNVLCSADFGDPTTRKRLFVQAVMGRRNIVWPDPTHAVSGDGGLLPYVPAWDIIDWGLKGRWIDEMPGQARYGGLPLSPNSLRRINKGFYKIGLRKFIMDCEHTGANGPQTRPLDRPLSTISTKAHKVLIEPFVIKLRGTSEAQLDGSASSLDEPIGTVSAGGRHFSLVEPYMFQMAHTGGDRVHSLDNPLPTVCGNRGDMALIEAAILPQQSCGRLRPVSEPLPTITCDGGMALVEPYLVKYYGTANAQCLDDPLDTVTCKDRHALVSPIIQIDGQLARVRYRYRMLQDHELALAQGFPADYEFAGNKSQRVKQIGNAVTCNLAAALVRAVLTQRSS